MASVLLGEHKELVMAVIQRFLPEGPDVDQDRLVLSCVYISYTLRKSPELRGRPLADYRHALGLWRELCYERGFPRGSINLSACWRAFCACFPKSERFGYFGEPPTPQQVFTGRKYRWTLPKVAQPREPVRV